LANKNKVNPCRGCKYKNISDLCGHCIENPSRRKDKEVKNPWGLEIDGKIRIDIQNVTVQEADVESLQKKLHREILKSLKRRF
jgi:hypothetical protein